MNYNYRVNPNMNFRPGRPMPIPDNDDRLNSLAKIGVLDNEKSLICA